MSKEKVTQQIANVIQENLKHFGYTKKEAAVLTGISAETLTRICKGERKPTLEQMLSIDVLFTWEKFTLAKLMERLNEMERKLSHDELSALESLKAEGKFDNYHPDSVRDVMMTTFRGSLDNYSKLINKNANFRKYSDRPAAYLWTALMERKFSVVPCDIKIIKKNKDAVIKKVLKVWFSDKRQDTRLDQLKDLLINNGIILGTGPAFKGAQVHGVSVKRGMKRLILISDYNKREYQFIQTLVHELLHTYSGEDHEDEVKSESSQIIAAYVEKNNIKDKDILVFIKANKDSAEMFNSSKEYFDYLYKNTNSALSLGDTATFIAETLMQKQL